MKHLDKVQLTTAMVIDFDDFRDIVYEVTDSKYDIEDEDSDWTFSDMTAKLEEYFEVQSICNFRTVSEYGSHEVMIPYIDY